MSKLTHFDGEGRAVMVDVGSKAVTTRRAVASGFVSMRAETLTLVTQNAAKKGDVISVAELAAVMGCLLYTSPSPRDGLLSRMPSSA